MGGAPRAERCSSGRLPKPDAEAYVLAGGGEGGGAGNEREFEDRAGGGVRVRKVRGMALG